MGAMMSRLPGCIPGMHWSSVYHLDCHALPHRVFRSPISIQAPWSAATSVLPGGGRPDQLAPWTRKSRTWVWVLRACFRRSFSRQCTSPHGPRPRDRLAHDGQSKRRARAGNIHVAKRARAGTQAGEGHARSVRTTLAHGRLVGDSGICQLSSVCRIIVKGREVFLRMKTPPKPQPPKHTKAWWRTRAAKPRAPTRAQFPILTPASEVAQRESTPSKGKLAPPVSVWTPDPRPNPWVRRWPAGGLPPRKWTSVSNPNSAPILVAPTPKVSGPGVSSVDAGEGEHPAAS